MDPSAEPGPAVDRDLPLDAHLHTDLSPDSDVPLDAYCALAVERGIPELAVTDHLDFDPRAPAHGFASFRARERTVREAAERWAGHGLAIRLGVEITYERRHEPTIRDYLAGHPYDFAIGSVHVGPDSPFRRDRVAAWLEHRTIAEAVAPYFAEVEAAAVSGLFDVIGHLDFVKRYVGQRFPPAAFAAAPELYEPVLRALVEGGTGLEVNASGLRQAPGEPYPPPPIVARFRALGGERVTAGSDAHRESQFAFGLAAAYAAIAATGFEALTFRRRAGGAGVRIPLGDPVPIPLRDRRPA